VANLAATGTANHLDFAGRVRREVVVQHERLGGLAQHVDAVDPLFIIGRAQRDRRERLSLAPLEERGAVRPRQQPGVDRDRTDGIEVSPVHPLALSSTWPASPVLDVVELGRDVLALSGNSAASWSRADWRSSLTLFARAALSRR
jgi:hypothetical protein